MKIRHPPKVGILVEITREFGRGLCRGISEFARATGAFSPYLVSVANLRRLEDLRTYDGFIARVMNDRIASTLAATKRPVVDVYYEKPRDGFAIVKTRHSRIGSLAAEHFLERRFRNFAFCGFAGGRFSDYCRAAFAHALARHDVACHDYRPTRRVRYDFNPQVLINERLLPAPDAQAIARWLQELPKPVGIFCPNDLRAWQLIQVCKQRGLDVPNEVAVLGLDNDVLVCGLSEPMISSIDPATEAIGRRAAETLADLIRNPALARKPIVREVDPVGVVERASTEIYPIEPNWLSDALIFIERHLGDNLSAADIYRHVGLSHTRVDQIFRAQLQTSVQGVIADMRLKRAQRLLASTSLSLREIAAQCGFSTSQYLIRSFTRRFQCPPGAWRTRM